MPRAVSRTQSGALDDADVAPEIRGAIETALKIYGALRSMEAKPAEGPMTRQ